MSEFILNTNILPVPIREKFRTPRVSVRNYDNGVIILPLNEIGEFRGIAKGSKFTTEKLLEYRQKEKAFEDRSIEEWKILSKINKKQCSKVFPKIMHCFLYI